ncbi:MAG: response regulator [Planctomycetes bacterium]|jgi:two-component system alkaline phosphatase synthesis response regulator PhoP|nr:response regulator [Planctomycetota bacterium]
MAQEKILIVEDEDDVIELVRYNLEKEGYLTDVAVTGREALVKAKSGVPDLVLLDLMLPEIDGLQVCKVIKNDPETAGVAVVMLTAKGTESDIVVGLEMGADDYITKPFSPRVLLARVKAVLRRQEQAGEAEKPVIRIHDIEIDTGKHRVLVRGKPIKLTSTEFNLLRFLAARPGWVFTRYQIVDAIHGNDYPVTDRSIDVQIVGLRKKLGNAGKYIETVRGVGYRFEEE